MSKTDKVDDNPPSAALCPMSNRGKVVHEMHAGTIPTVFDVRSELCYWLPFEDKETANWHSVDMVRLSFKIDPMGDDEAGSKASEWWYKSTEADRVDSWPSIKPNQFEAVYTLYWGDFDEDGKFDKETAVSMTAGVGWIDATGKRNPFTGFVEFNPNKVGQFAIDTLRAFVSRFKTRLKLERWDYAVDVPRARRTLLMAKDGRNYESHVGRSVTTYLGRRNTVGRVKVYDKTAESNLPVPVTRIEVTYGRPMLTDEGAVQEPKPNQWPTVGVLASPARAAMNQDGITLALALSLLQLIESEQDIEPILQTMESRHTRGKVRDALISEVVGFNLKAWTWCALSALAWETPDDLAARLIK